MNTTDKAENNDNATFEMKLGNDLSFAGRNVEPVTDSRTVASVQEMDKRIDRCMTCGAPASRTSENEGYSNCCNDRITMATLKEILED